MRGAWFAATIWVVLAGCGGGSPNANGRSGGAAAAGTAGGPNGGAGGAVPATGGGTAGAPGGAGGGAPGPSGPGPIVEFGDPDGYSALAWSGSALIALDAQSGYMVSSGSSGAWALSGAAFYSSQGAAALWDGTRFVTLDRVGRVNTSTSDPTQLMVLAPAKQPPVGAFALAWTGALYVAVGDAGLISTSPDLVTWTKRTSGTTDPLIAVVWTGTQLFALGSAGTILASPDGAAWTAQRDALSGHRFTGLAWSGARFVLTGDLFTQTSTDGKTWKEVDGLTWLVCAAWSPQLGLFAALGTGAILTSPDGATWTSHPSPTAVPMSSVIWAGDRFVAAGSGIIMSSRDGGHWTVESLGLPLHDVVWAGDHFLAAGAAGTYLTSPDGLSWTVWSTGDGSQTLESAVASPTTDVFGVQANLLSSIGLTGWTMTYLGTVTQCDGLVWTGSECLAVCTDGTFQAAADCTSWSGGIITSASDEWSDVVWTGSQFVAVGNSGKIATSPDGTTWTAQASGTAQELSAVAWSGQQLVAVGNGVSTTSLDGVSWTAGAISGAPQLNDVAWAGSRFLAVGNNATVAQSTDGVTWTYTAATIPTNKLLGQTLRAIAFSGTRSVVVGDSGIILAVDR